MVIYIMADIGSVSGGWLSMRLINRGWSINAARKTVMLGCALCVTPVFLVSQQIGLWPSVFLIGLAAASHLGFSANLFTVATDTVPKHAVSSVAGIGGMAAAVGGMFIAKLVGLRARHHAQLCDSVRHRRRVCISWRWGFCICCCRHWSR